MNVQVKYALPSAPCRYPSIRDDKETFIHLFFFRLTTRMTGASSSSTWQSWRPSSSPSSTGTSQTSHSPGLNRLERFRDYLRHKVHRKSCNVREWVASLAWRGGVEAGQILPSWLTGKGERGCRSRISTVSYIRHSKLRVFLPFYLFGEIKS
jgi:hypothetical protein